MKRLRIVSFGYKFGLPDEADIVLDVRCLTNPFWVAELRSSSGLEAVVEDYVLSFEESRNFIKATLDWLNTVVPQYFLNGRETLTVAVGCTGGRHRSVVVGEKIAQGLNPSGLTVELEHRDIERDALLEIEDPASKE